MELVDYKGKINNFPKYLKELKLKADITTMAQNMIKNEINNYDGIDKYFEIKEKNKNNFYNELYLSQYSS